MRNADKPAHPTEIGFSGGKPQPEMQTGNTKALFPGLSKREHFAGLAMQHVPAPTVFVGEKETEESYKKWAEKCVNMADELLKALGE